MNTDSTQLPRPQLNAIKWVADRCNGNASMVMPETLRALEENGFITFKNLVKSDPFPYPADGIDPAQARVPYLNAKAWELSGRPRCEGSIRVVFMSDDSDDDLKRHEIEIVPAHPGIVVVTHDKAWRKPDVHVTVEKAAEDFVSKIVDAAMRSGYRGVTLDDQSLWWNGRQVEIPRDTDAGSAVRMLFKALGLDETLLPKDFPGVEPKAKSRSMEMA